MSAIISNCCSAGENSYADSVTGIVRRRNEETGVVEPAGIKPLVEAPAPQTAATNTSGSNSIQSETLSAILSVQEISTEQQNRPAPSAIKAAYGDLA